MDGLTTVVLGGGVGGLTAANELRGLLGSEHRVVLVDRHADHLFAPSLLWLMVGGRRPEQLSRPLRGLVRRGVEVRRADVRGIDAERRAIATEDGELRYDELVVALGAELAPELMPGYAEAAHNFFEVAGAARFAEALGVFRGGRVVVAVTALPYKCPAAPYEAALLVEAELRRRRLRERSEVVIVTPESQPMPVAGPALGAAVRGLLEARGIVLRAERQVASIDAAARELVLADGTRERFDLLAATPPHRAPAVVRGSTLAAPTGWIPVDPRTLRAQGGDAYAIGDVAAITLPGGKLLPKAGVFAHAEGLVVARNIAARRLGGASAAFDGHGYCWVELGQGRAAFASGDFYAEPAPRIALHAPGVAWHVGKVLFERAWMGRGAERWLAGTALRLGARVLGLAPVNL